MRRSFYLTMLLMLLVPMAARCQFTRCEVAAAPVSFGSYAPFSAQASASTGTVTIRCDLLKMGAYTIELSSGLSGSLSGRQMSSGQARLSYQLYLNSAHTTVWGDGTNGTSEAAGNGLSCGVSCDNSYTVYGSIPAQQTTLPTGTYSDSITVTVIY
jgi:spore coat protein U-like protein